MSLDVVSKITSIQYFLRKNNTNTSVYDISAGLKNDMRVTCFYKGVNGLHEQIPTIKLLYPVVFIEVDTQVEEFAQLGNRCKLRNVELNINIIPVTMFEAPANAENADLEIIQLAQNIEGLIRSDITLSQTVRESNISSVDYAVVARENTYNNIAKIQLSTVYLTE